MANMTQFFFISLTLLLDSHMAKRGISSAWRLIVKQHFLHSTVHVHLRVRNHCGLQSLNVRSFGTLLSISKPAYCCADLGVNVKRLSGTYCLESFLNCLFTDMLQ